MATLADIEAAVVSVSPAEKQALTLFLASRLRIEGATLPEPCAFTSDEMAGWIAEDEADIRRPGPAVASQPMRSHGLKYDMRSTPMCT